MHVRHDICMDCDSDVAKTFSQDVLAALETPYCKLHCDLPTDQVHGSVTIAFCDTRMLGEDELSFNDGHRELATAENIGPWWEEQGHRLEKIVGNKSVVAASRI